VGSLLDVVVAGCAQALRAAATKTGKTAFFINVLTCVVDLGRAKFTDGWPGVALYVMLQAKALLGHLPE
jgi:hypothetical protein